MTTLNFLLQYETKTILVEAGSAWQKLPDAEKQPYEEQAAKLKAAFEKEMEAYKLKQSKTKEARKPKKPMWDSAFFHAAMKPPFPQERILALYGRF